MAAQRDWWKEVLQVHQSSELRTVFALENDDLDEDAAAALSEAFESTGKVHGNMFGPPGTALEHICLHIVLCPNTWPHNELITPLPGFTHQELQEARFLGLVRSGQEDQGDDDSEFDSEDFESDEEDFEVDVEFDDEFDSDEEDEEDEWGEEEEEDEEEEYEEEGEEGEDEGQEQGEERDDEEGQLVGNDQADAAHGPQNAQGDDQDAAAVQGQGQGQARDDNNNNEDDDSDADSNEGDEAVPLHGGLPQQLPANFHERVEEMAAALLREQRDRQQEQAGEEQGQEDQQRWIGDMFEHARRLFEGIPRYLRRNNGNGRGEHGEDVEFEEDDGDSMGSGRMGRATYRRRRIAALREALQQRASAHRAHLESQHISTWYERPPIVYVTGNVDCQHLTQHDDGRLVIDHLWEAGTTTLVDLFAALQEILLTPGDHGPLGLRALVNASRNAACPACTHAGGDPSRWRPQPQDTVHLGLAPLPDTSAQDQVDALLAQDEIVTIDGIVTQAERQETLGDIKCYVTLETLLDPEPGSVFGFGLTVDYFHNEVVRGITSPCEYMTWEAFKCGSRLGMYKQPLMAFLPLYLTREHAEYAYPLLQFMLNRLSHTLSDCPVPGINHYVPKPAKLRTLANMLNATVVSAMKAEAEGNAERARQTDVLAQPLSLRLLEGYHQMVRVLKFVLDNDPRLQAELDAMMQRFVTAPPEQRTKAHFRNLGEVLALVPFSKFRWEEIIPAYVQESMVRGVRWYVTEHPELLEEDLPAEERAKLVFDAMRVSRTLLCFQAFFVRNVAQRASFDDVLFSCDARCGRLPPALAQEMMRMTRQVHAHSTWADYFEFIGHPPQSPEQLQEMLLHALRSSKQLGYHS